MVSIRSLLDILLKWSLHYVVRIRIFHVTEIGGSCCQHGLRFGAAVCNLLHVSNTAVVDKSCTHHSQIYSIICSLIRFVAAPCLICNIYFNIQLFTKIGTKCSGVQYRHMLPLAHFQLSETPGGEVRARIVSNRDVGGWCCYCAVQSEFRGQRADGISL